MLVPEFSVRCYAPRVAEFWNRHREALLLALAILSAMVVSTVGLAYLIHSGIQNDLVAVLLGALAFTVPAALVVTVFMRRNRKPAPETTDVPSSKGWLEIEGDDEIGYTISGDAQALSALGEVCRDLSECSAATLEGKLSIPTAQDIMVVRQDIRPAVPPPTWRERLGAIGCVALLLVLCAVWLRGCVAVEADLERLLR